MLDLVISATCSAAVHAAGKYISQTRKYCPHHKHAWLQLERARWITTRYVFTVEKMFWAIENMDQSQNKIPVALTRKIHGRLYIYSVVGSANSSTKYNCQYTSRLYRRGAKRLMRKGVGIGGKREIQITRQKFCLVISATTILRVYHARPPLRQTVTWPRFG
jgi:hypothetical protein